VKLSRRMLDPLGLSRVSQWMTDQLLPGITAVTNVARNYSFYSWAIENLLKKNKVIKRNQFASHLTKRESAFVIASIFHDENNADKAKPHGYDKAKRFINKSNDGKLQVAFNVSDSNSEGFYGLYYKTAMYRLGLTIRSRLFDDLTPLGRQLATSFEANIRHTKYFKDHVQDDDVEKSVLSEYGDCACICQLVKPSEERNILRKIFFRENLKSRILEKSRRETLVMVLYLIKQCSSMAINFTDDIFRDAIFFGQVTDGKSIFNVDLKGLDKIAARWHLFQLHEFFTYGLESLLHALLSELKKRDDGMMLADFFKEIGDPSKAVGRILMASSVDTIQTTVLSILKNLHSDELNTISSDHFDRDCNLEKDVSEKTAFEALKEANKKIDSQNIIANSVAILILNYLRAYRLLDTIDPVTLWFNNRAFSELSPVLFAQEIKKKAPVWSIDKFVRFCFKTITDRHDLIAYEKLFYGNDTFRFEEKGNRLKFKMDIYPNYPSQRSSRIDSVLSIIEQLGLVEKQEGIRKITLDGEKILGEFLNERSDRPY